MANFSFKRKSFLTRSQSKALLWEYLTDFLLPIDFPLEKESCLAGKGLGQEKYDILENSPNFLQPASSSVPNKLGNYSATDHACKEASLPPYK
jgi:hypothetical protein